MRLVWLSLTGTRDTIHDSLPPSDFRPLQNRTLVKKEMANSWFFLLTRAISNQISILTSPQKCQKNVMKPVKQCCLSSVLALWVIHSLLSWAAAALSNEANELATTSLWHYWHTELNNTAPFGKSRYKMCWNKWMHVSRHHAPCSSHLNIPSCMFQKIPLAMFLSFLTCYYRSFLSSPSSYSISVVDR